MAFFNMKKDFKRNGELSNRGWLKITFSLVILVIIVSLCVLIAYDFDNTANDYMEYAKEEQNSGLLDSKAKFRKQYEVQIEAKVEASKTEVSDGSQTSSSSSINVKGDGQLITDSSKNPYKLPLYDGLTMDAKKLGCKSYSVPYADNPFDAIKQASQPGKYIITCENRRCEGGSASWNWYDEVNYSPSAKCGEILPYTEIDGRMSIAVPWRWTMDPDTYPFTQPAGNTSGTADTVGFYYDVVFNDGTVLACIGGSAKGVEYDTNSKYQGYMHYQACPIEVVQYTDLPVGKPWKDGYAYGVKMCQQNGIPVVGDIGPSWSSLIDTSRGIKEVVVYRVQHYTPTQGYKNWFTGD